MDHAETLAKTVIERTLEGSKMSFRRGQNRGEYDFDLHYKGGTWALEVTSATNRDIEEVHAAITAHRKGGQNVPATRSTKNWIVLPSVDARINTIRENVDQYLAAIERDGIEQFWAPTDDRPSVESIYRDLRVVSGVVLPEEPAGIHIGLPITGGACGSSLVNAAVEREASKEDNRKKLGKAGTEQRHLAVYVPLLNSTVWSALVDLGPRLELPRLPSEITDVWVYSEAREDCTYVVCHANSLSPWSCIRGRWETVGSS